MPHNKKGVFLLPRIWISLTYEDLPRERIAGSCLCALDRLTAEI